MISRYLDISSEWCLDILKYLLNDTVARLQQGRGHVEKLRICSSRRRSALFRCGTSPSTQTLGSIKIWLPKTNNVPKISSLWIWISSEWLCFGHSPVQVGDLWKNFGRKFVQLYANTSLTRCTAFTNLIDLVEIPFHISFTDYFDTFSKSSHPRVPILMGRRLLLLDGEGFINILKTGHFYFH